MAKIVARSALFFGKVVKSDTRKAVKVCIDKYQMDKRLIMYFKEKTEVYAFDDAKTLCNEGDYVIIQELPKSTDENVLYNVKNIVYKRGNFIDPVSGEKCAGTECIDDIERTVELFSRKRSYQKAKSNM